MRLYLQKPMAALRSHAKKLLYMAYRLCQIFRNWLKLLYDEVTKINNNRNKNHPQKLPETGLYEGSRRTKLFAFGIWFLSWLFSDLHSKLSFDLENLCLAQHVTHDLKYIS